MNFFLFPIKFLLIILHEYNLILYSYKCITGDKKHSTMMALSIKEKYDRQERRMHLKEMSSKRQMWCKIIDIILVHRRITTSLYSSINEYKNRKIRYDSPLFLTVIKWFLIAFTSEKNILFSLQIKISLHDKKCVWFFYYKIDTLWRSVMKRRIFLETSFLLPSTFLP